LVGGCWLSVVGFPHQLLNCQLSTAAIGPHIS